MELALRNESGSSGTIEVTEKAFGAPYNESLVHQVVTAYMAGARSGTKAQKSRSDVRGGGAKPFRQKGTGRARAGTIRSPIWRSGGVTFASRPRDYSQKVNRKMYRAAMRSLLSELARCDRLVLVDDFSVDAPKTKAVAERLRALDCNDVLVVTEGHDETLALAVRNLPWASVIQASQVNPVSLIAFEKVLMTSAACKLFEGRLV